MSFSEGFMRGFNAVETFKDSKRKDAAIAEEQRRFDLENRRVEQDRAKAQELEDAKRGLNRWDNFVQGALSEPEFQDADGNLDQNKALNSPVFQKAFAEIVNNDPILADQIRTRAETSGHEVHGVAGLIPTEGGKVAIGLDVTSADGSRGIRPLTPNRSDDPAEPAGQYTLSEIDDLIRSRYGEYQSGITTLRGRQDELSVLRGDEPSASRSAPGSLADAPLAPEAQPVAQTEPGGAQAFGAGERPAVPEGTPLGEATPEAPSAEPEAVPTPPEDRPATLQEEQQQRDLAPGPAARAVKRYKEGLRENASDTIIRSLDMDDGLGRDIRRNPKKYMKTFVSSADKVRERSGPGEYKRIQDHFRQDLMLEKGKLSNTVLESTGTKRDRARAELDRIDEALDPLVADQPPSPNVTVADARTPARVQETADTIPEPTETQMAVSSNEVARPTRRSVRSGKPSNRQLLAAMRLQKQGVLTNEQVSTYARTGSMETEQFKVLTADGNVFRVSETDPNAPIETLYRKDAATGMRGTRGGRNVTDKEYFEQGLKGQKQINAMLKAEELSQPDFWRRLGESSRDLAARGITIDPYELAESPVLQGVLVESYRDAMRRDDPGGWFSDPVIGRISDAYDSRYGTPTPTQIKTRDGQTLDAERFAQNNNMSTEDATRVLRELADQGAVPGGSQQGTGPLAR